MVKDDSGVVQFIQTVGLELICDSKAPEQAMGETPHGACEHDDGPKEETQSDAAASRGGFAMTESQRSNRDAAHA